MAAALAETIGRLEAAEAQNRRFVADVAHELRTPLAALVAEASILREHLDALPEASRRAGELLVSDVGRLRSLVDDLMEVSRFDAHAEQIAVEPVDLGRLVRAVTASRLPEASLSLPRSPLVIETDPRRFDRIVANLLDNAREHAPAAPVAVVARDRHGRGEIVVAVTDRGPGVPPDRLARIFERFYKADPSRHGGSSGLGLAIAAEHAALLGGYLTASNLRRGRPAHGAPAACDRIVTARRCDGDRRGRCSDGTDPLPRSLVMSSSLPFRTALSPHRRHRARRRLLAARPAASGPSRPSPPTAIGRADQPRPHPGPERQRRRRPSEPSEPSDDPSGAPDPPPTVHAPPRPRRRPAP